MSIFLDLIRHDAFIPVNKRLLKILGANTTIFYCELATRYCYFKDRGMLIKEEWFFNTVADLEEATTLSEYTQRHAVKKLVEIGLIEIKSFGLPCRRHFRMTTDDNKIQEILGKLEKLAKNEMVGKLELEENGLNSSTIKNLSTDDIKNLSTDTIKNLSTIPLKTSAHNNNNVITTINNNNLITLSSEKNFFESDSIANDEDFMGHYHQPENGEREIKDDVLEIKNEEIPNAPSLDKESNKKARTKFSSKERIELKERFTKEIWDKYPESRKIGFDSCFNAFVCAIKKGSTANEICQGMDFCVTFFKKNNILPQFIKMLNNWIMSEEWKDLKSMTARYTREKNLRAVENMRRTAEYYSKNPMQGV